MINAPGSIVSTASREGIGREIEVRADGTRVGVTGYFADDPDEPRTEGPVLADRRYSYRLVEITPDGTRRETPLGETRLPR